MRIRLLLVAASCLAMTGTEACSCESNPDGIYFEFQPDLYVGDKVKGRAVAASSNEYCKLPRDSDDDPGAYSFSTSDPSVALVSSTGEVTAVSAGSTTIAVTRYGVHGSGRVYVARPIAEVRITATPASPAVGDTVNAISEAIDYGGQVTPGAHFTGLYVDPIPAAGGASPVTLLPQSPDRIRFVIKSPGKYILRNATTHLGNAVPTGRLEINVP